jgi:hypothetical protein
MKIVRLSALVLSSLILATPIVVSSTAYSQTPSCNQICANRCNGGGFSSGKARAGREVQPSGACISNCIPKCEQRKRSGAGPKQ